MFCPGELSQSKLLQHGRGRLNPVPESLNSPDVPVPRLNNGRPRKDDPALLYSRGDIMAASFTASPRYSLLDLSTVVV